MPTRLITAIFSLAVYCLPPLAYSNSNVDFGRDILPILRANCFECHDERKSTAGFRLDLRENALKGGESGESGIIPGKSSESPIITRVTSDDEFTMMPPEGERLSPQEIDLLKKWIDDGANWPDELSAVNNSANHWAFTRPQRPEFPSVGNQAWIRNEIDQFILERLEAEGLAPSPQADPAILIRRLHLDLIGLLPSIKDVDAFLVDNSDRAYERIVNKLLDSPHYGERWGRHWLDAARYADSDGFEKDKSRQVWFYRDWVINALNRDLPYDQFVIEQIAGDLLPDASQEQIVATGFLRNSMINEEGGIDPEQFRMEAMFDRMDAIGKGILGLTIQCAQCHNHKYDPLTQENYYRMFAFINSSHEANIAVYTPAEQARRAEIFRKIKEIEAELKHRHPDWPERMAAWEAEVTADQTDWTVVRPDVDDISTGGQKYLPQHDGSFLAQGYAPTKHRVKLALQTDLQDITAFRLELMTDPNLPLQGPGRSVKGTGALTEFEVEAAPVDAPEKTNKIKIVEAFADVNPPIQPLDDIFDDKSGKTRVTGPIALAIDADNDTAWGIDVGPGRRNQPRKAVFRAEAPISHPGGTVLTFYLTQNHGGWNSDDNQNHNLGRFRLSITTAPDAKADPSPANVRKILNIPANDRSPAQIDTIFSYWRTTVDAWEEANARIESLWSQHPEGFSQLVLDERDNPRSTHLLKRGDFLSPQESVEPGVPDFLHDLPDGAPPARLSFARWLTDPASPTTARSIVNRVWQSYFGTGLVETSEDFGIRAEPPSHPKLLDWLSVEFMERGWSLKELHRLIVNSATYRQSSRVTPELYSLDPYNRLLARGPRFRMEAEIVRDVALAASGLLNPRIGGPSVFPPLPDFMLQPPVSYGPKVWYEDHGQDRYRRAIYTFRYRSLPYPVLQTFDAPNGDFSCVRRARSNTPLQALMTLNEPIFMESAQALAQKTLEAGGSNDEQRLVYAFRRCLARMPTDSERSELQTFLHEQKQRLAEGWLNAWDLATGAVDEKPTLPNGVTPTDLAAWTALSRVLLNLDETITKQ